MPNIDPGAKEWQADLAARVGQAVQRARKRGGWTAQDLSRRCADLGYPISRVAISKIESNSRAGKLDLAELIVLAAALETSPVNLVYPGPYDTEIELLPQSTVVEYVAAQWFSGFSDRFDRIGEITIDNAEMLQRFEQWIGNTALLSEMREMMDLIATRDNMDNPEHIASLNRSIQASEGRLARLLGRQVDMEILDPPLNFT